MYNWFLNLFGWNQWFMTVSDEMRPMAIIFQKTFNTVGQSTALVTLLGVSLLVCLFYYFVWNNIPGYKFRIMHWMAFLGLNAVLVGLLTFIIVRIVILDNPVFASAPFWPLALINAIYSLIIFFIFSMMVTKTPLKKRTNASCTPF